MSETPNYSDLTLEDLNYESYLRIPEMLNLQTEIARPRHHDEMFFIIIHQASELWFKLILHETDTLVEALREGSVSRALKNLKRIRAIFQLLVQQIQLLNTLTPVEFAGFRDHLRPASGFQSVQFRTLEFRFGLREEFFLRFFESRPEVVEVLNQIRAEPSVYDEILACFDRAGFQMPRAVLERSWSSEYIPHPKVTEKFLEVYRDPKTEYHWVLLCEALVDLDETFLHWRNAHMVMVRRTIGNKTGTGGSAGYDFLETRAKKCFFPELWDVRNHIGGAYGT